MEGLFKKMKNIHRDPSLSPRGLVLGTAKKTSSKRHILGDLLPGNGRMRSGHRSPAGSLTSLYRHPTPAILVFLAVLALGLLFLLPGGLLQAQSAEQFFDYPENGDGPVATFTAGDPEGATPSFWSLTDSTDAGDVDVDDIADEDLFKIDQNGVLSFKTSPSYEPARDTPYRVTVQVSDGSINEYFKAYINVTDVEETGKITWTVTPSGGSAISGLQQFQLGAELIPAVTDPDGLTTVTAWKWYRGSAVISGETGATYDVVSGDVGNRIRVEATYSDGSGPAETVSFMSPQPVQAFRRTADNMAPAFASTIVTRRVEENSTGNVGGPVTATDGNGDKLTYTISSANPTNTFDHDSNEATPNIDRFKIDPATGQLMTVVKLDYEAVDDYEVTVGATDSAGNNVDGTVQPINATVTINVIDVDEKPTFTGENNPAGVVAAQTEGMTGIDTNTSNNTVDAATFTASDPEDENVTLTLMGDDAGSFELADDTELGNDVNQVLSFKEKTDFEMPGDRNRDNVYEVTVRASDGTMNADRMLIIKVINDADEGGKVTLSPEDAVVGVELTATLAHMEGGVSASGQITNPTWQWQRAAVPSAPDETCADVMNWEAIENATKDTYTPVSDDRDPGAIPSGGCLSAMVNYNYQFMTARSPARSVGTAVLVSQANQAPKFMDGTRTFRVVMESVKAATPNDDALVNTEDNEDDNVGSPIVATDANGDDPTYTLSGAGASKFRVRSNGQIEVKDKLDHEANASHTVTLMANDGSGTSNATASITVTIYVTDVDEAPTIKDRADSAAVGMRTVDYRENSTGPVARFTAGDPEGATPSFWSLTDSMDAESVVVTDIADRASFEIDQNGVLSFRSPPSYEDNSDSGSGNTEAKNYQVVVQASDANNNGLFELTVAVTDVEETGKVTWIVGPDGTADANDGIRLQQFQPGAQLLASVSDPDGDAEAVPTGWKWYRDSTRIITDDADDNTYTVVAADVDKHIRVEATFTDANRGAAETRSFRSENPVQEVRPSGDNTAPAFSPTRVTRRVEENSTGNVGGPVTATDGNGDKLTYTISSANPTNTFDHDSNEATPNIDRFKIDPATGQLMTVVKLDYEAVDDYEVTVGATDSAGNNVDDTVQLINATVTINVIDVDEKPTFTGENNPAGVVAAQTEGMTGIDTNTSNNTVDAATFTASDPEDENVTLTLMGDDAGSFELADDTELGNDVNQVLSFKEKTDFEMPGDRNRDNVYEVTVRASDGTMNADRMLIIKVINDADEGGKVTLSPEDAVVGVELTATLAHMEGGVSASGQITNPTWQWQRAAVPSAPDETCADVMNWEAIENATKDTYTPVSDDRDPGAIPSGGCLSAMVNYNYQFMTARSPARSVGTAVLVSQANQAPKFMDGTRTFRVVMESVKAATPNDDALVNTEDNEDDNVGSPIVATDANGDMVTYTLSGADASLFRVRSNGQIEVKDKLDHEANASHTVTLTADDGSGTSNATASITVTIYVTDVDEKPVIMVVPTENQAPRFPSSSTTRSIPEGQSSGRAIGARVTATDPGDSLTYTLEGRDAASFSIDSRTGQLRTSASLDQGTRSSYTVTVRATDSGGLYDTITVTITVTEVRGEQMGEVTLWAGADALTMAPQVGDTITGAVMDPDGGVTGETWQWARTMTPDVMASWMDIQDATDAAYMVTAGDEGYHLRVMATYTDAVGTDTVMEYSLATMMVMMVTSNNAPVFQDDQGMDITETTRMVDENTAAGENVGTPVMAMDADNEGLTYSLGGTDMASFDIDMATGQIMVGAGTMLDYETKDTYMVSVTATDGTASDTVDVTIMVSDVMLGELADTYDADKNEMISRSEVIAAIDDYFDSGGQTPTKDQIFGLITLHFAS